MRPAYVTRCPNCCERLEVPDEWQTEKIKDDKGKTRTITWFDPDRWISEKHSC